MKRSRAWLGVYLLALVVFTSVHSIPWIVGGLVLWAALAGRRAPSLLKRAGLAVVIFNLSVSSGVVLIGLLDGGVDTTWLLRANLRVLLLTACTFLLVARVDLDDALAPWPGLRTVVVLARGQIRVLQRLLEDFRLGLRSRSLRRPGPRVLARHGATTGSFFLGKALHDAEELSLALRARGAWRDPGD